MDRNKAMQAGERLLQQGDVPAALTELERVARNSADDLLVLNRIGDLLARSGQIGEAIGYYSRIADQFTQQGFFPKAVAIHKKVLRLDPNNTNTLMRLGELYLKQELSSEARGFFLRAAELCLARQAFGEAREVYTRLVAAEPDDPLHRARLAETRAAEGDTEGAGQELLELGGRLFESGKPEDAEKAYRRAGELLPSRHEPFLGIARCLTETGREDDALELLRREAAKESADDDLLGELFVRCEVAGRQDEALGLLQRPNGRGIPDAAFSTLLGIRLRQGQADQFWARFGPVFEGWTSDGDRARLGGLYHVLVRSEPDGHLPALERLAELQEAAGDRVELARTLEQLARAYRTGDMEERAAHALAKLHDIAPQAAVREQDEPRVAKEETPEPATSESVEVAAPADTEEPPPIEAEAPAVPLNRADEEFVAGRMTQAEILEKYGLEEQALEQVREVAEKFPGLVKAQQRLVALLRRGDDVEKLRPALVRLALARRAAGETDEAQQVALEVYRLGGLDESSVQMLRQLGLLQETGQEQPAEEEPPVATGPTAAAAVQKTQPHDEGAVFIDFDQADEVEAEVAPEPAEQPVEVEVVAEAPEPESRADAVPTGARPPAPEELQEIRTCLERGERGVAYQRVQALKTLGYDSDELERLAAEVGPPAEPTAAAGFDDDDLSTITAALESELFAEQAEVPVPEETEQSLEEVFATFKERVSEEIDSEDYRTHYDLGIAYKEMELIDAAIGEFEIAVKAPEFFREACVMLAICHRERQDAVEAAQWYRKAADAPGSDPRARAGLCYDLAEVLLQAGDPSGALEVFRDLLQTDPSFRDVQDRVGEIEASLTSR